MFRTLSITAAVALLAGFLLGFVPQRRNADKSQDELQAAKEQLNTQREALELYKARDAAALLHLEITRKNFGIASQYASQLFTQVRSLAGWMSAAGVKQELEQITAQRDALTASLAQGDASAEGLARDLLDRLHKLQIPARSAATGAQ